MVNFLYYFNIWKFVHFFLKFAPMGYDGEGKRVDQKGRGRNRRYCYYGQKLLWEKREAGERKRSYVLGYGIEGVEEEGKRYYYQKDERESTKYVSDDEGEIRNR